MGLRGLAGLAARADEVLALGRLHAAEIGDRAAHLGREGLGGLGRRAVLEGGLDRRPRDLFFEVGLAERELLDDEGQPPGRAVGVDGPVGEPELGEALLGQLGQRAERRFDERGGELLDADLEQQVARFGEHSGGSYPRTPWRVSTSRGIHPTRLPPRAFRQVDAQRSDRP